MSDQNRKRIRRTLDARKGSAGERIVALASITRSKELQIRFKLNEQAISSYTAAARSSENALPPVEVVRVNGSALLVDGWHRMAAHERAGQETIKAIITDGTVAYARRRAALANLQHGVRPNRLELRKAFAQFIKGEGHIEDGELLSLRMIQRRMGGGVSHNTIRNWLMKDHPDVAAAIAENHSETPPRNSDALTVVSIRHGNAALSALNVVFEEVRYVERNDLERQWPIYERAVKLVTSLERLWGRDLEQRFLEAFGDEFDTTPAANNPAP